MTREEALSLRSPYQAACTRVWNAAQRHGVELAIAMGFFSAIDWEELAEGRMSDEALGLVMADISTRADVQERLRKREKEHD